MKTIIYIAGLMLMVSALAIPEYAEAQTRRKTKKEYSYNDKRTYSQTNKRFRRSDRDYEIKQYPHEMHKKRHGKKHTYTKNKKYHHKKQGVKNHNRCYHHPRYGNVVMRFTTPPVMIRHNQGHYYYSGGHYYRYRPHIGYIRINAPYSTCFHELPYGWRRFAFNGHIYYTAGDLYFVKYRRGFRLVSRPAGIHICARL